MKLETIDLSRLSASPINPRQAIGSTEELQASIKAVGLLAPLVVRKLEDNRFEIVAGHRRFDAVRELGWERVDCLVEKHGDSAVAEIQLVENIQRKNLTPIEEADAFNRLKNDFSYSPEMIATRVGVNRSLVYSRLRLCLLTGEARKALVDGVIDASVGVLLARLSHAAQAKLVQKLAGLSTAHQTEIIKTQHTVSLRSAPFKLGDSKLDPEAGSCDACPKNSKCATPGLFEDITKGSPTCTDVPCYESKVRAAWEKKTKNEDAIIKSVAEGRSLFKFSNLAYGSKYAEASEQCQEDPKKRTWGELAATLKEPPKKILAPDADLKVRELVLRDKVIESLAASGSKWAQKANETETKNETEQKETAPEQRFHVPPELYFKIGDLFEISSANTGKISIDARLAHVLIEGCLVFDYQDELSQQAFDYFGLKLTKKVEELSTADKKKALKIAVAYLFLNHIQYAKSEKRETEANAIAKAFGIDLNKIMEKSKAKEDAEKLFKPKKGTK